MKSNLKATRKQYLSENTNSNDRGFLIWNQGGQKEVAHIFPALKEKRKKQKTKNLSTANSVSGKIILQEWRGDRYSQTKEKWMQIKPCYSPVGSLCDFSRAFTWWGVGKTYIFYKIDFWASALHLWGELDFYWALPLPPLWLSHSWCADHGWRHPHLQSEVCVSFTRALSPQAWPLHLSSYVHSLPHPIPEPLSTSPSASNMLASFLT